MQDRMGWRQGIVANRNWSTSIALFFTFLLGLCVGSFLNAIIFRVHEGESALRGRSKCMKCEEPLSPLDLIPVLSFFLLRGQCRHCKASIDWQYPLVEFATGLLFLIAFVFSPTILLLVRNFFFLSFLIIIFVYDFRHMLILDEFTIPAMIIATILNLWLGVVPVMSMLSGATLLSGFFYLQFVLSKGAWIGGGDIRLGALMGLMLGFEQAAVALFIAYLFGALFGIVLLALKKANRKTPIPFGAFLTFATVVMLFLGDTPLDWYLSLFV